MRASDQATGSRDVFAALNAALQEAKRARPDRFHQMHCLFSGRVARIEIVGDALGESVRSPLAHLMVDDERLTVHGLTIQLWDQAETGVECEPGWMCGEVADAPGFSVSDDGRFVRNILRRSVSCLDRQAQRLVGCTADAAHLSLYERGRPLHAPLARWHSDRNAPLIHAALVSRHGRGVLLAGAAGAGKTTAALACLCAGLDFLGDDLVGLEHLENGSFVGHSIYGSTFLDLDALARFPPLTRRAISGTYAWEEKRLVLLSEVVPTRMARSASIVAMAVVRVGSSERSAIQPASKRDLLLALAPGSLFMSRTESGKRDFERLVQLVEQVPSFRLDMGSDLQEIPPLVEELLSP